MIIYPICLHVDVMKQEMRDHDDLNEHRSSKKRARASVMEKIGHQLDNSLKSILARFMWVFGVLRTEG